jgi:hypothetical protein
MPTGSGDLLPESDALITLKKARNRAGTATVLLAAIGLFLAIESAVQLKTYKAELATIAKDESKWLSAITRIDQHSLSWNPYLVDKLIGLLHSSCLTEQEQNLFHEVGSELLEEQVSHRNAQSDRILLQHSHANRGLIDGHTTSIRTDCCTTDPGKKKQQNCATGYSRLGIIGGGWHDHLENLVQNSWNKKSQVDPNDLNQDLLLSDSDLRAKRFFAKHFSKQASRELLQHWKSWESQRNWLISGITDYHQPDFIPDRTADRYTLNPVISEAEESGYKFFRYEFFGPVKGDINSVPSYLSFGADLYINASNNLPELRSRVSEQLATVRRVKIQIKEQAEKNHIRASLGSVFSAPLPLLIQMASVLTGLTYLLYWTVSSKVREQNANLSRLTEMDDYFWFPRLGSPLDPLAAPWPKRSQWIGRITWSAFHFFPLWLLYSVAFADSSPLNLYQRAQSTQGVLNIICAALFLSTFLAMTDETRSNEIPALDELTRNGAASTFFIEQWVVSTVSFFFILSAIWLISYKVQSEFTPWTLLHAVVVGIIFAKALPASLVKFRRKFRFSFVLALFFLASAALSVLR